MIVIRANLRRIWRELLSFFAAMSAFLAVRDLTATLLGEIPPENIHLSVARATTLMVDMAKLVTRIIMSLGKNMPALIYENRPV